MKVFAMYLPQFHEVKENNEWWGEGFTEWEAVKKAECFYEGHMQPKVPLENNYYDLMKKETMQWQADLMKKYDIDGLCFYHYWFADGRKILEKPAENLLKWDDINIPFCFAWANESWVRSWSGVNNSNVWSHKFEKIRDGKAVLLEQEYGEEEHWKKHFDYVVRFFLDDRYIKVDGCPVFMIYKPNDILCLKKMIDKWNIWIKDYGFERIVFIGANCDKKTSDIVDMNYIHEPLHTKSKVRASVGTPDLPIRIDYSDLWNAILGSYASQQSIYGGFVNYDDTPRHELKGTIICNSSPDKFQNFLTRLLAKNEAEGNTFTFINAWNEWGEGMYLEPDSNVGYAYLNAIKNAKENYKEYIEEYVNRRKNKVLDIYSGNMLIEEKMVRYKKYWELFDKWIGLKNRNISLEQYLVQAGINNVVIYGLGIFGKHLYDELNGGAVKVEHCIDKRQITYKNIETKRLQDISDKTKPVIIAVNYDVEDIKEELHKSGFEYVMTLEEIINKSV